MSGSVSGWAFEGQWPRLVWYGYCHDIEGLCRSSLGALVYDIEGQCRGRFVSLLVSEVPWFMTLKHNVGAGLFVC